jgi:hypothetical protein
MSRVQARSEPATRAPGGGTIDLKPGLIEQAGEELPS